MNIASWLDENSNRYYPSTSSGGNSYTHHINNNNVGNHQHTISPNSFGITHSIHHTVDAVDTNSVSLKYLESILSRYFEKYNIDIEEVKMKDLYDFIVMEEPKLIEFVPQTVERCKLALSTEWSCRVRDAIKLPFTGELYKFYLKMKLTHGSLK